MMFGVQEEISIQTATGAQTSEFEARFLRCENLLYFTADRILPNRADASRAVLNCWRTASREARAFAYEGDFRSWLLRVLIDEAVAIRGLRKQLILCLEVVQ